MSLAHRTLGILALAAASAAALAAPSGLLILDPDAETLADLATLAERTGERLEIAPDARTALLTAEPPSRPAAASDRSIPLATTPIWSSAEEYAVGGLRWIDFDGDGDLDLASAHYYGGYPERPQETRIWRNDDGLLGTQAAWVSTDAIWSTDCIVGDIDRDGRLDLAVVNYGTNKIHFHPEAGLERRRPGPAPTGSSRWAERSAT